MATMTIIRKGNKKAKKAFESVRSRKAEISAFIKAGGKIEDFHPKEKAFA